MQTVTIKTDTEVVSGRITSKEVEQVRQTAYDLRLSVSKLVAQSIRHYLEHLAKQKDVHNATN